VDIIFLKECFVRNVKWAIQKVPELENTLNVQERLAKTWSASLTSMRLIMFQVYFLRLARPSGRLVDDCLGIYNKSCGIPSNGMKGNLSKAVKTIFSINTWKDFFKFIGTQEPPTDVLFNILKSSMDTSAQRRYHRPSRGGVGGGGGGRGGGGGGRGRGYR